MIAAATKVGAREALRKEGFILMRSVIDPKLLQTAQGLVWETIRGYGEALKQEEGELPYCIPLPFRDHYPIIDHAEELLIGLGAEPFNLQNAMLIMKRPHEGRRYWHTDLSPIFEPAKEDAAELFVIYMLQATTVERGNGCLLVVPGYADGPQHSDRITTPMAEEYPIETEPGDVIIMDPRLLHASLPNETESYRFNIRLWIQTRWRN